MVEQSNRHAFTKAGCFGALGAWLLVAAIAVYIVHRTIGWPWGPMAPIALVIALGGSFFTMMWVQMKGLDSLREDFERRTQEIRSRILPLSIDEAHRRAMRLLNDPGKFQCERSQATSVDLTQLGRETQRFFAEFESIAGPLSLSRAEIRESDHVSGWIVIGDLYGDGHTELVTRPGDDRVCLVDLEDEPIQAVEHAPSIWHCILLEAEEDEHSVGSA